MFSTHSAAMGSPTPHVCTPDPLLPALWTCAPSPPRVLRPSVSSHRGPYSLQDRLPPLLELQPHYAQVNTNKESSHAGKQLEMELNEKREQAVVIWHRARPFYPFTHLFAHTCSPANHLVTFLWSLSYASLKFCTTTRRSSASHNMTPYLVGSYPPQPCKMI